MVNRKPAVKKRVRIGGQEYIIVSDDRYLSDMGAVFEPYMVRLFSALVKPADCVIDAGANIGMTALLFAQLAAKVVCFEPVPSTWEWLVKNIKQAEPAVIEAVNLGLGDCETGSTVTYSAENRSGGFVSQNIQPQRGHITEQVQIRRLDDIYQKYTDRIDFVKLDVEGYEQNVLGGMEQILHRFQPRVVLELNHWCLNAFQRITVPDFFDFLKERFPYLYAYDATGAVRDLHDPEQEYEVMYHHITAFRYSNLFCGFDAGLEAAVAELNG